MFEVKLVKNSSGLGFSFCREDSVSPEQPGSSIVRVKKLFPGQPAAESGQIEVGDVILKVNGASLKGLSQQVSASLHSVIVVTLENACRLKLVLSFQSHVLLGSNRGPPGYVARSYPSPLQAAAWNTS